MPYMRKGVDAPIGAVPYGPVLRIGHYRVGADAAAIYPGDFVIMESDGELGVAATNSTQIIGVAAEYNAASTADTAFAVYDHPDQLFMIQDDGDTTAATATAIGNNTALITTTGDTTLLRSKHEIDSDGIGTTSTLPVRILGLHPVEDAFATTTAQQRKWIVRINTHVYGGWEVTGV